MVPPHIISPVRPLLSRLKEKGKEIHSSSKKYFKSWNSQSCKVLSNAKQGLKQVLSQMRWHPLEPDFQIETGKVRFCSHSCPMNCPTEISLMISAKKTLTTTKLSTACKLYKLVPVKQLITVFETNCDTCVKYHVCEDEDGIWYSDVIFFSSYTGITIKAF